MLRVRRQRVELSRLVTLCLVVTMILVGCSVSGAQANTSASGRGAAVPTGTAVTGFDPSVGAPLPDNRIIAAYGIAGGSVVNGPASSIDQLNVYLPQLKALGQQYAAQDPVHPVKLAVDLVVNVFQGGGYCGTAYDTTGDCSSWVPEDLIQQYIDFCKQNNLLLILDLQLGTEPVQVAIHDTRLNQVDILPYLQQYSFVELQLDTEFHFPDSAYGRAQADAYARGSMPASEINFAIDTLASISQQYRLPRKILVFDQFYPEVFPDKDNIKHDPNVSLVLQADGIANYPAGFNDKALEYQEFVQQDLIEYGGYKLYQYYQGSTSFDEDPSGNIRIQTPQEVLQLFPQPLYISIQ